MHNHVAKGKDLLHLTKTPEYVAVKSGELTSRSARDECFGPFPSCPSCPSCPAFPGVYTKTHLIHHMHPPRPPAHPLSKQPKIASPNSEEFAGWERVTLRPLFPDYLTLSPPSQTVPPYPSPQKTLDERTRKCKTQNQNPVSKSRVKSSTAARAKLRVGIPMVWNRLSFRRHKIEKRVVIRWISQGK